MSIICPDGALTITTAASLTVVITVLTPAHDSTQHALERAIRRVETAAKTAGFVASAIHCSVDGQRILEYAQWRDPASWSHALRQLSQPDAEELRSADARVYEVVQVVGAPATRSLNISRIAQLTTMINILSTDVGRQGELLNVWQQGAAGYWQSMPGAMGAAIHRSRDGARLVNYAQWAQAADWQRARQTANSNRAGSHGLGTSDPRLYDLVLVTTA